MGKIIDLKGKKFGRWTVIEVAEKRYGQFQWKCQCDCGSIKNVAGQSLRVGVTTSCGCRRLEVVKELHKTHGMSKTRLHVVWKGMRARCSNPNHKAFKHYGARGIRVCERWNSFEHFHADMAPSFVDGLSLERIKNDLGYAPENCVWATALQQAANRRPRSVTQ